MTPEEHAVRAENVRWFLATGEHAQGAAARLGITYAAFEAWCRKHDRQAWHALIDRNPIDHNAPSNRNRRVYEW